MYTLFFFVFNTLVISNMLYSIFVFRLLEIRHSVIGNDNGFSISPPCIARARDRNAASTAAVDMSENAHCKNNISMSASAGTASLCALSNLK